MLHLIADKVTCIFTVTCSLDSTVFAERASCFKDFIPIFQADIRCSSFIPSDAIVQDTTRRPVLYRGAYIISLNIQSISRKHVMRSTEFSVDETLQMFSGLLPFVVWISVISIYYLIILGTDDAKLGTG